MILPKAGVLNDIMPDLLPVIASSGFLPWAMERPIAAPMIEPMGPAADPMALPAMEPTTPRAMFPVSVLAGWMPNIPPLGCVWMPELPSGPAMPGAEGADGTEGTPREVDCIPRGLVVVVTPYWLVTLVLPN